MNQPPNAMKNNILYYGFIALGIILALFVILYGAYLPWTKSRSYIRALQAMQSINSVEQFKIAFSKPLDLGSPIGSEEITKFLGNTIQGIVAQSGQPEEVSRELVQFIRPYFSQENVIHLLTLGNLHEMLWRNYGQKEEDFVIAEQYYLHALELGPRVPPTLYALLGLYQARGEVGFEKFANIAKTILTYWPDAFPGQPVTP